MTINLTLYSVNAILILWNKDGSRLLAQYFKPPHLKDAPASAQASQPYATVQAQKDFEKGLYAKTKTSTNLNSADIILYDGHVVVFKAESDVTLCVVGGLQENELLLHHVCLALRDSLNILLNNTIDRSTIADQYDVVSLAVDEIVDDGVILETDPSAIAARVSRSAPKDEMPGLNEIDLTEQGLKRAWDFGKGFMIEKIRQGL